jgi:hypothetical protein
VEFLCSGSLGLQLSRLRICFQLLSAHAVKEIVHRNGFRAVNPLTGSIDLRIGLDSSDHGKSGDINFTSFFDDSFQGRPDVSLALLE